MNIYLTEMYIDKKVYAGPNIVAEDIIEATIKAHNIQKDLVVIGVLKEVIDIDDIFDNETENIVLH
jgi:regulatory protein YycI of two-component signal transduction system YycFG|tara:strand:+ start:145 stop:342 length:198 start_codon:yes stop_codon:yes gene_type:complete